VNYDIHYHGKLEELRESKLKEKMKKSTFIETEEEPGIIPEIILKIIDYIHISHKIRIQEKK